MNHPEKHSRWWLFVLVAGVIPLILILEDRFDIPQRSVLPVILLAVLVAGTMGIWMRANAKANGDEWWQDDSSSGWRGY